MWNVFGELVFQQNFPENSAKNTLVFRKQKCVFIISKTCSCRKTKIAWKTNEVGIIMDKTLKDGMVGVNKIDEVIAIKVVPRRNNYEHS